MLHFPLHYARQPADDETSEADSDDETSEVRFAVNDRVVYASTKGPVYATVISLRAGVWYRRDGDDTEPKKLRSKNKKKLRLVEHVDAKMVADLTEKVNFWKEKDSETREKHIETGRTILSTIPSILDEKDVLQIVALTKAIDVFMDDEIDSLETYADNNTTWMRSILERDTTSTNDKCTYLKDWIRRVIPAHLGANPGTTQSTMRLTMMAAASSIIIHAVGADEQKEGGAAQER